MNAEREDTRDFKQALRQAVARWQIERSMLIIGDSSSFGNRG
jgi:hypothetical protein